MIYVVPEQGKSFILKRLNYVGGPPNRKASVLFGFVRDIYGIS